MEVGIHHFTWAPNSESQYDMDAYMAILFGGENWDLC